MRFTLMTPLGIIAFAGAAIAQPSLPSTFRGRTVASPEGASFFVHSRPIRASRTRPRGVLRGPVRAAR